MRPADWLDRLYALIAEQRDTPQVWGQWDCCQMVGAAVLAMTGEDKRQLFAPYASEREALEIIAGFGSLPDLLTSTFGDPIPVAAAKRGDVVCFTSWESPACGICLGLQAAVVGPLGMQFHRTLDASSAWRVE